MDKNSYSIDFAHLEEASIIIFANGFCLAYWILDIDVLEIQTTISFSFAG